MGYYEMIKEAILALKDRTGSSSMAIKKVGSYSSSCALQKSHIATGHVLTPGPARTVHRVRSPGDQVRTALAAGCAQDGRREGQACHGESFLQALSRGEEAAQEEEGAVRMYTTVSSLLPRPLITNPVPARLGFPGTQEEEGRT